MPTPDPKAEPTALVVEENIYASMRTRVLADGFSPLRSKKSQKKFKNNIGHHPKKKKKERQKCSDVYMFFTSTLKEITAEGPAQVLRREKNKSRTSNSRSKMTSIFL